MSDRSSAIGVELLLGFNPGVTIAQSVEDRRDVYGAPGVVAVPARPAGFASVASLLASGGGTHAQIATAFLDAGAPEGVGVADMPAADRAAMAATLSVQLMLWWRQGFLRTTLVANGAPLAILVPMTRGVALEPDEVDRTARWRLSRFAYLRRGDEAMLLESPRAPARMLLPGHAAMAAIAALSTPRSAAELGDVADGPGPAAALALVALLASAGLIETADAHGGLREDTDATLQQWEFHDLLFHARSRRGRHHDPVGATYRFLDRRPPLPAIAPARPPEFVPLVEPDLAQLAATDLPFTVVLESRGSMRRFGETPITLLQLGEFLYRVARVRRIVPPDGSAGLPYEITSRPYPSGGATYDLEVYVTVNLCADLSAGLYHYAPLDHRLERISGRTTEVEALLQQASACAGLVDLPQVLLTLTSRFQRVSWKYSSIAYATTLKNAGVLYQTMYLAATAMGLAACALGTGDADLFARAAGTGYFAESSVGEFVLGTCVSVRE